MSNVKEYNKLYFTSALYQIKCNKQNKKRKNEKEFLA